MIKAFLPLVLLASALLLGPPATANELSAVRKATESDEYERLKGRYRECVLEKARQYRKVTSIESAIEHAPIACHREFLGIRQFLLSGAFKVEVIDQLMDSVAQGVQIDLINAVYDEALREKGILQ